MQIVVAAFYADVPGKPSRLPDYLPLIQASRKALEFTNPGARYVLMTDALTAPEIEPHAEVWVAAVPPETPLMCKIIQAQALFAAECKADLLVLPDVDCFANRALDDAIPKHVGLAITHKGPKYCHRINNLAYARDMDLATWVLARAAAILESWPVEAQEWWGDQEAWGAALGTNINGLGVSNSYIPLERVGDEIFLARPARRAVYVYPCVTHNCPLREDGSIRDAQLNSYFCHLKGPRKQHVERFMMERFGL
jgi:hypothetical protein